MMLSGFLKPGFGFWVAVISCGDPGSIANGIYIGDEFTFNKTVQYHCNPGFLLEHDGPPSLRCTQDGSWNQSRPSCRGEPISSRAGWRGHRRVCPLLA